MGAAALRRHRGPGGRRCDRFAQCSKNWRPPSPPPLRCSGLLGTCPWDLGTRMAGRFVAVQYPPALSERGAKVSFGPQRAELVKNANVEFDPHSELRASKTAFCAPSCALLWDFIVVSMLETTLCFATRCASLLFVACEKRLSCCVPPQVPQSER